MQTGAIGTAGGGLIGSVIGKASGNAEIGAVIGANIGGETGSVIGSKMDKQADEIKKDVQDVKVERVGENILVEFKSKVLFNYNQSDLSVTAEHNLDKIAKVFQKYPETNIEIQGHTDNKGSDKYNQALSQRRATSVATYLNKKGVNYTRITARGLGETSPKYDNGSETGRIENRRVELLISANEKMKDGSRQELGKQ
jgi:outer membrane protein OmpA-like peptidoglycan-associated protein